MSRAEAMHLYVQAIEVFDERWIEWRGLQAAVVAAVGAVTPAVTPVPNGGRNGVHGNKVDVASTLGSMRALRSTLDRLPQAQQQSLRDECDALSRALDVLRVPPATR